MFKTFNFTYVFTVEGADPYITTFTALTRANAEAQAWNEVAEHYELSVEDDWTEVTLIAVFQTEPGALFKSLK